MPEKSRDHPSKSLSRAVVDSQLPRTERVAASRPGVRTASPTLRFQPAGIRPYLLPAIAVQQGSPFPGTGPRWQPLGRRSNGIGTSREARRGITDARRGAGRARSSTPPESSPPAKADGEFFAAHTVGELAGWSDYDLEALGRLAEPVRFNPANDRYEPISRTDAFALAGSNLSGFGESRSGLVRHLERISIEATFPYQLWVREFETG
jgi:hypothetical protein